VAADAAGFFGGEPVAECLGRDGAGVGAFGQGEEEAP